MKTFVKKMIMLVVGFLVYAGCYISRSCLELEYAVNVVFIILQYAGMLAFIFGVNYFGTRYMYEKHPEESRDALIEQNDERTNAIRNLAKAKSFDFMIYVWIGLAVLLLETEAGLVAVIGSIAALLAAGIFYAYFRFKYSKEM